MALIAPFKAKYLAPAVLLGFSMSPAAHAALLTYTGGLADFSFTTSLSGGSLDNLSAGTDITSSIVGGINFTNGLPASDTGGFPSADWSLSGETVKIGTDASGDVTSWDITGTYFVSFPAFPGEDPNDFYGTYNASITNLGDSATLITDNDAGFAPTSVSVGAGSWQTSDVPEPTGAILWGGAILGALIVRPRRATV
jgi:hypothetical protein